MLRRKKLSIIIVLLISMMGIGWSFSKTVQLKFENNSNIHVDSVVFFINNYEHIMKAIPANTTKTEIVNMDSVVLNNHDVVVRAQLYIKDSMFRGTYFYNDLYGKPSRGYKLILTKELIPKLISEEN